MEEQELKEIVAQNIFYLRTVHHLTQFELGEQLNYSDKAVSKWERAEGIPDAYNLKKIAQLFSVSVDYLLERHEEQNKSVVLRPRKNKKIITNIVVVGVMALALLAFVVLALLQKGYHWQFFIYALVPACIVEIVFAYVWQKGEFALLYVSGLIWSILTSVYFGIADYSKWMIFLLGIPAQIIIFLVFRIKISIRFTKKELDNQLPFGKAKKDEKKD